MVAVVVAVAVAVAVVVAVAVAVVVVVAVVVMVVVAVVVMVVVVVAVAVAVAVVVVVVVAVAVAVAVGVGVMQLRPISLKQAKEFVMKHHRHNKPPTGWKFGVGLDVEGELIGVATGGRPIARHFDDGFTLEVNRTCTDGTKNANSMLYGAIWRAAKALGYTRCITYTQSSETGASLRGAGWIRVKELPPRKSWAESSVALRDKRDPIGNGGVARVLWEIRR